MATHQRMRSRPMLPPLAASRSGTPTPGMPTDATIAAAASGEEADMPAVALPPPAVADADRRIAHESRTEVGLQLSGTADTRARVESRPLLAARQSFSAGTSAGDDSAPDIPVRVSSTPLSPPLDAPHSASPAGVQLRSPSAGDSAMQRLLAVARADSQRLLTSDDAPVQHVAIKIRTPPKEDRRVAWNGIADDSKAESTAGTLAVPATHSAPASVSVSVAPSPLQRARTFGAPPSPPTSNSASITVLPVSSSSVWSCWRPNSAHQRATSVQLVGESDELDGVGEPGADPSWDSQMPLKAPPMGLFDRVTAAMPRPCRRTVGGLRICSWTLLILLVAVGVALTTWQWLYFVDLVERLISQRYAASCLEQSQRFDSRIAVFVGKFIVMSAYFAAQRQYRTPTVNGLGTSLRGGYTSLTYCQRVSSANRDMFESLHGVPIQSWNSTTQSLQNATGSVGADRALYPVMLHFHVDDYMLDASARVDHGLTLPLMLDLASLPGMQSVLEEMEETDAQIISEPSYVADYRAVTSLADLNDPEHSFWPAAGHLSHAHDGVEHVLSSSSGYRALLVSPAIHRNTTSREHRGVLVTSFDVTTLLWQMRYSSSDPRLLDDATLKKLELNNVPSDDETAEVSIMLPEGVHIYHEDAAQTKAQDHYVDAGANHAHGTTALQISWPLHSYTSTSIFPVGTVYTCKASERAQLHFSDLNHLRVVMGAVFLAFVALAALLFGLLMRFHNAVWLERAQKTHSMKLMQEARQQAELARDAKANSLAFVCHELRNPLHAVLSMSELLRDAAASLDSEQRDALFTIHASSELMLAVTNDVLDLSKMDAGKMELDMVDCDLHALIHSLVRANHSHAQERGISVKGTISPRVPRYIKADPTRLNQCLTNLMSNSIKFSNKHGEVRLEVELDEEDSSGGDAAGEPSLAMPLSQEVESVMPPLASPSAGVRSLAASPLSTRVQVLQGQGLHASGDSPDLHMQPSFTATHRSVRRILRPTSRALDMQSMDMGRLFQPATPNTNTPGHTSSNSSPHVMHNHSPHMMQESAAKGSPLLLPARRKQTGVGGGSTTPVHTPNLHSRTLTNNALHLPSHHPLHSELLLPGAALSMRQNSPSLKPVATPVPAHTPVSTNPMCGPPPSPLLGAEAARRPRHAMIQQHPTPSGSESVSPMVTSNARVTAPALSLPCTVRLRFSVSDDGAGIPAEFVPVLFVPYTQAKRSLTKSSGGTGLGLAIIKKLADLMTMTIQVDTQVDVGSRFSLSADFMAVPPPSRSIAQLMKEQPQQLAAQQPTRLMNYGELGNSLPSVVDKKSTLQSNMEGAGGEGGDMTIIPPLPTRESQQQPFVPSLPSPMQEPMRRDLYPILSPPRGEHSPTEDSPTEESERVPAGSSISHVTVHTAATTRPPSSVEGGFTPLTATEGSETPSQRLNGGSFTSASHGSPRRDAYLMEPPRRRLATSKGSSRVPVEVTAADGTGASDNESTAMASPVTAPPVHDAAASSLFVPSWPDGVTSSSPSMGASAAGTHRSSVSTSLAPHAGIELPWVLVVDDAKINRKITRKTLQNDFRIDEAENGQEAVDMVTANPTKYACVCLDLMMPVMDGTAALIELRSRGFSALPIIALTANTLASDVSACLRVGFTAFIGKPCRSSVVLAKVKELAAAHVSLLKAAQIKASGADGGSSSASASVSVTPHQPARPLTDTATLNDVAASPSRAEPLTVHT